MKRRIQCPALHKLGVATLEMDQEDHSEFMLIWELKARPGYLRSCLKNTPSIPALKRQTEVGGSL